jgi:predicted ATPase
VTELETLRGRLQERRSFSQLVGRSQPMQGIYRLIEDLSDSDATVLILGESGTGKERVAEAIHEHSRRRGGPLVKVNCSALSEGLLESELFGHVKGAFTGAIRDQVGRFEQASGGTAGHAPHYPVAEDAEERSWQVWSKRSRTTISKRNWPASSRCWSISGLPGAVPAG